MRITYWQQLKDQTWGIAVEGGTGIGLDEGEGMTAARARERRRERAAAKAAGYDGAGRVVPGATGATVDAGGDL